MPVINWPLVVVVTICIYTYLKVFPNLSVDVVSVWLIALIRYEI